jgi:hypothetical protein
MTCACRSGPIPFAEDDTIVSYGAPPLDARVFKWNGILAYEDAHSRRVRIHPSMSDSRVLQMVRKIKDNQVQNVPVGWTSMPRQCRGYLKAPEKQHRPQSHCTQVPPSTFDPRHLGLYNVPGGFSDCPLHVLARSSHDLGLKLLLKRKAQVDVRNEVHPSGSRLGWLACIYS